MAQIADMAGWILWLLTLGMGFLGFYDIGRKDEYLRSQDKKQGLILLLGCVATATFPISKFWLLGVMPVSVILSQISFLERFKLWRSKKESRDRFGHSPERFTQLMEESKRFEQEQAARLAQLRADRAEALKKSEAEEEN